MLRDERLYFRPLAAGQSEPDPRRVNGRPQLPRLGRDLLEARRDSLIPDRPAGAAPPDAALPNHIGDPNVRLDLHEVRSAEPKPAGLDGGVPRPVLRLWSLPPV